MCGIAGIMGSSNATVMENMLSQIAHRGPDDWGIERFDHLPHHDCAILGHRRLSIIDLSPRGHQPMSNEDGTIWVVFNGEIYNFAIIRRALEEAGHHFRSETDTEVIVHGYEEWGAACIDRFNGMFAFGIFDTTKDELLLVRDRLGIKPLYYSNVDKRFLFASEIKAILAADGTRREIDPASLDLYLNLGYVPGPRTLFKEIVKLQPGTMLRLRRGEITLTEYWAWPSPTRTHESFDDQAEHLRELLDRAVADRLVSDVPLGSFLSGGLDSSVVTALMARNLDTGRRPQTFCVGYERRADRHDERAYAQIVARHIGTDHRDVVCTNDFVAEALPRLIWHMDEPIAEELLAPYARLCELAREDVTVVLSGEGADEFLYGYRYYCLESLRQWTGIIPRPLRRAARWSLNRIPYRDNLRISAVRCCLQDTPVDSFLEWAAFFSRAERAALYGDGIRGECLAADLPELWQGDFQHIGQDDRDVAPCLDARYRMVDYILSRTDRLSMAVGLEARVPFLDHRIVEFLSQVPASHKIRGFQGKQLLRRAISDALPDGVVRRQKKPFGAPVGEWLQPLLERFLSPGFLVRDGILNAESVRNVMERALIRATSHTKLWLILVLEIWYRIYICQELSIPTSANESKMVSV